MRNEFESEKEKKNRKRGILIAFFFHAALVIFGLLPFLTREVKEPKYEKVIEVQFAQLDAASKKADDKAGAKKKTEAKKRTEKKVKKVEPKKKPTPKPEPVVKKRKPVVTSEAKTPPIKTDPTPTKVEKPTPKPTPTPEPVEEVEETSDDAETTDATTKSDKESAGTSAKDGAGKGDSGKDKGEGKSGAGKEGDDFKGTAIFSRKVIYRPDIKKIVKKNGRIAINLCINNEGRVIYVKYDKASSTIRDTDNIRKTLEATKLYKFERDYSVPKEQCGKLTFIIENN
jgi:outer membrane biosynthesis protein TonB